MGSGDSDRERAERARAVGVFRYQVISEALDPQLTPRQRGRVVRALAEMAHPGPFGGMEHVSRTSIDRWLRAWRTGGFDALVPQPARVQPRTPAEVLSAAIALKLERPDRTAAQVARVLRLSHGWSPSERTLQRHFARMEPAPPRPDAVFGRFEAAVPNELWVGDALHGPLVGGRKTFLFAFLDDHCAPRGATPYPRRSREELEGRFLGPMAYLDPKGEGDNSMPGKQRSCSGV